MGKEEEKEREKEEEKRKRKCKCSYPCTSYNPNVYVFLMWSRR